MSITSSQCYPNGYQTLFAAGLPFSPGVCPDGYAYKSTKPYSKDAIAALCCPVLVEAVLRRLGRERIANNLIVVGPAMIMAWDVIYS